MNSHAAATFDRSHNAFVSAPVSFLLLCIILTLLSGCAASKSGSVAEGTDATGQTRLPDAVNRSTADAATETAIQEAQDEQARLSAAQQVIETAKSQIGVPYRYGGTSPASGFDCSGFVKWSFAQHGVTLPRTSRQQLHAGIPVEQSELKAGDLIIFTRRIGSRASTHAGLYIGEGKFIHSPSAGRTVCIESLHDEHYQKRYIGARRVILDADEVKVYAAQQKKRREFRESGAIHTVRRGQTLSGIARKYGVTVRAILRENKLTRSSILQIDQKLRIPGAKSVASREDKPTPKFIDATPDAPSTTESTSHTVASGDSVWSIARRYGVSQQAIVQANNLTRRHTLQIGQNLVIPGKTTAAASSAPSDAPAPTAPAKASAEASVEASPEIKAGASCTIYTVQSGDTAWSIAKRHGTSAATLLEANGLAKNHVLQIGQKLRVPGTASATALTEPREPRTMQVYSVKRGDTIWSLARKHGVSTRTLLEANGLNKNSVLSLGQQLRIPVASAQ